MTSQTSTGQTSTGQTFTDAERRLTLAALMIVFLLSALDQTIVSTAMPRIISELNGLNLYSWVTTAYLLTSTVMVPIWGKLGDIFGRKPVLIAEGFGAHVPKGYIYAAMAFSAGVEALNMLARKATGKKTPPGETRH